MPAVSARGGRLSPVDLPFRRALRQLAPTLGASQMAWIGFDNSIALHMTGGPETEAVADPVAMALKDLLCFKALLVVHKRQDGTVVTVLHLGSDEVYALNVAANKVAWAQPDRFTSQYLRRLSAW